MLVSLRLAWNLGGDIACGSSTGYLFAESSVFMTVSRVASSLLHIISSFQQHFARKPVGNVFMHLNQLTYKHKTRKNCFNHNNYMAYMKLL